MTPEKRILKSAALRTILKSLRCTDSQNSP
jgi:hypothetical protein